MGRILTTTSDHVAGFDVVQTIGVVRGNTVRARHMGHDLMASLKTVVGGEINSYTDLMTQAREEAINRMLEDAEERGADAVIAMRFETSDIMQSAAEILVYGTAVKIRPRMDE